MKPLFSDAKVAQPVFDAPATAALVPRETALPAVSAPQESYTLPAIKDEDISNLGTEAQAGLGAVSQRLLQSVKASDAGALGSELNQLVALAKGLDPESLKDKGVLGRLFGAARSAKERLMAEYASVESQMNKLVVELDKKAELHRQRVADLEQMYEANMAHHARLERDVAVGEQRAQQWLAAYTAAANQPVTDSFASQKLADVKRHIDRMEKRVDDLRRAMLLAKQMAPQIRMMQDNARALVEKVGDVKMVTLPAWGNVFSLYVLQLEQANTVQLLDGVDEATNAALRQGADLLRENTTAIATARQRSVVTLETLAHAQRQLLGSLDDSARIEAEARSQRALAKPQIEALEKELITRFVPGQR